MADTLAKRPPVEVASARCRLGPMAEVVLRSPLRELAGGSSRLTVDATTVGELIRRLESEHPRLSGWILDEQGRIREHVKVFVNGEVATHDEALGEQDRVHVLPAISGGASGG